MTLDELKRRVEIEIAALRGAKQVVLDRKLIKPQELQAAYEALNEEIVSRFDVARCKTLRDDSVVEARKEQYQKQIDSCAAMNASAKEKLALLETRYVEFFGIFRSLCEAQESAA